MAANRAANKPVAGANLLGKWQHMSLDILTLRARKSTDGDVVSHVDEKVGTHDGQPFFRVVRLLVRARRAPKIGRAAVRSDMRQYYNGRPETIANQPNR
jgi:hypothetical protein